MIRCNRWFFAATVLWIANEPRPARADDVQVNTYTTDNQINSSLAMGADDDIVVVWQSFGSSGTDNRSYSIQGQRYSADGDALGGEFQVNTYTTSNQRAPSVAMAAGGDFVVVWHGFGSAGTDSDDNSIQGQRYFSDGSPLGGEFQVNTYTTSHQIYSSVAMAADGDFVVVWTSNGSGGTDSDSYSIQGQRYDSNGALVGGEFQVNTYTTSSQRDPSIAMAAGGDFIVVWNSDGSGGTDSDGFSVQGQRYDSNGVLVGGEFQVNSYTSTGQVGPSVAVAVGGDFVVVWTSFGSGGTDSSSWSIHGQRFASDGFPLSDEFQVNTYTTGLQNGASIASAADGTFVVVWASNGSGGTDSDGFSIQGQHYASDGSAVGGQFQINCYTTSRQTHPSVVLGGEFVVAWHSNGSGGTDTYNSYPYINGHSIQRTPTNSIFADGFESGDTSSWSSTTSTPML